MKNRILKWLFIGMLVSGTQLHAQDLTNTVKSVGEDAARGYFGTPIVTIIGAGMNSGWYNSSKQLSLFGLPFGVSIAQVSMPFVGVDDGLKTFNLKSDIPLRPFLEGMGVTVPEELEDDLDGNLNVNLVGLPTFLGSEDRETLTLRQLLVGGGINQGGGADSLVAAIDLHNSLPGTQKLNLDQSRELPFQGVGDIGTNYVPSVPGITAATFSVGEIPYIDNFTFGLRYFPSIPMGEIDFSIGGFMVGHDFTRFVPVVKDLPFLTLSSYVSNSWLGFESDMVALELSNWIWMVNGSIDFKVPILGGAGLYGGLGFETSTMTLDIDSYEIPSESATPIIAPGYSIEVAGDNFIRAQLGARLSLLIFDLYGDVNVGSVTVYNVGVTLLGLNGL